MHSFGHRVVFRSEVRAIEWLVEIQHVKHVLLLEAGSEHAARIETNWKLFGGFALKSLRVCNFEHGSFVVWKFCCLEVLNPILNPILTRS